MSVAGAPAQTEYANQPAIDAVEDGTVWHTPPPETIPEKSRTASVISEPLTFDPTAEEKNLEDMEKNKANVAEIYPWINEEASQKKKVTTIAQLVKENKRRGMSARHNMILDLTDEVRQLRAEVEDVLFYSQPTYEEKSHMIRREDHKHKRKLRHQLNYIYNEHYQLKERFQRFCDDIDVASVEYAPSFEYNPPEDPAVTAHRDIRKFEYTIKRFFTRDVYTDDDVDAAYAECKDDKFDF